jgi:hypothetical protein
MLWAPRGARFFWISGMKMFSQLKIGQRLGAGFAVVADEVRKLAETSANIATADARYRRWLARSGGPLPDLKRGGVVAAMEDGRPEVVQSQPNSMRRISPRMKI